MRHPCAARVVLLLTRKPQITSNVTRIKASSGFDCIDSSTRLTRRLEHVAVAAAVETRPSLTTHIGQQLVESFPRSRV